MIIELTKNNLTELTNSLVDTSVIKHELEINPFAKVLLYKEKGKVIGYLYYSDIYERAEINQIEVDVLHRNCGKASELLQKMIEAVEKDITLEVREDNISALKLYEKFGFQKTAIRKGYYQGTDAILMERKHKKKSNNKEAL